MLTIVGQIASIYDIYHIFIIYLSPIYIFYFSILYVSLTIFLQIFIIPIVNLVSLFYLYFIQAICESGLILDLWACKHWYPHLLFLNLCWNCLYFIISSLSNFELFLLTICVNLLIINVIFLVLYCHPLIFHIFILIFLMMSLTYCLMNCISIFISIFILG